MGGGRGGSVVSKTIFTGVHVPQKVKTAGVESGKELKNIYIHLYYNITLIDQTIPYTTYVHYNTIISVNASPRCYFEYNIDKSSLYLFYNKIM